MMTEEINVKIECGGYTITGYAGTGVASIIADEKRKPAWVGKKDGKLVVWSGSGYTSSGVFFYIESDTHGKLHKFKGVEYLGLVDAPVDHEKMLRDLLEKFKGALVLVNGGFTAVIYNDKVIASGCSQLAAILADGALGNLDHHLYTDGGNFYKLRANPLVSLEMIDVAKSLGDQFIREYERLMKL
jgi:hypothetical protein